MSARLVLMLAVVAALSGCRAKIGECDQAALERTIVYTSTGEPMYAGQALVHRYCGIQCHGSTLTGGQREGAPFGFNLDVIHLDRSVCTEGNLNSDACLLEQRRLAEAAQIAFDFRDLSWNEISQDRMPPVGAKNLPESDESGFFFATEDGTQVDLNNPVPSLREGEARDLVRNWFACGLPVVGPLVTEGEFSAVCMAPEGTVGQCRVAEEPRQEIQPTFTDIYTFFTESAQSCQQSNCHDGTSAPLDLSSREAAYMALTMDSASAGGDCEGDGRYVDTETPENSLLYRKLLATSEDPDDAVCGDEMPRGRVRAYPSTFIDDGILQWIADGAMDN